jgi:hypothetical protein
MDSETELIIQEWTRWLQRQVQHEEAWWIGEKMQESDGKMIKKHEVEDEDWSLS